MQAEEQKIVPVLHALAAWLLSVTAWEVRACLQTPGICVSHESVHMSTLQYPLIAHALRAHACKGTMEQAATCRNQLRWDDGPVVDEFCICLRPCSRRTKCAHCSATVQRNRLVRWRRARPPPEPAGAGARRRPSCWSAWPPARAPRARRPAPTARAPWRRWWSRAATSTQRRAPARARCACASRRCRQLDRLAAAPRRPVAAALRSGAALARGVQALQGLALPSCAALATLAPVHRARCANAAGAACACRQAVEQHPLGLASIWAQQPRGLAPAAGEAAGAGADAELFSTWKFRPSEESRRISDYIW
jgi:hypothetical protein